MNARGVVAGVLLSTLMMSGAAWANETGTLEYAPGDVAMIGFDSAMHDFGEIDAGSVLEHDFLFINNGTSDLIIEKAYSRSSGTSVMASHKPIDTGEIGQISVKFDTAGLSGDHTVRVKVESNAYNGPSTLYMKLTAIEPAEAMVDAENATVED